MTEHKLEYVAGLLGFGRDGGPYWYCTCRQWRVNLDHKGSPCLETAKRKHRAHIKATQS